MNYQRIHDEIIADSRLSSPIGFKHNNKTMGYKERHHIVPRCMGGTNDPTNLVYLTARRHFIIHRLLTKIYPENIKILHAFHMMFTNISTRKLDSDWIKSKSKNYDYFKTELSNKMKGNLRNLGRKHSTESRLKMSISSMGKTISLEQRKAISKAQLGNKNMLGKVHSEKTKAEWSKKRKGIVLSEEHKKKISEGNYRRWARMKSNITTN